MQSENFVYVDPDCQTEGGSAVPFSGPYAGQNFHTRKPLGESKRSVGEIKKPLGEVKKPLGEIKLRQRPTAAIGNNNVTQQASQPQGCGENFIPSKLSLKDITASITTKTSATNTTKQILATEISLSSSNNFEEQNDITFDYSLSSTNEENAYSDEMAVLEARRRNLTLGGFPNDENYSSFGAYGAEGDDEMMMSTSDYHHDDIESTSLINFDVSFISKCDDYADDIESYMLVLERTPSLRPTPNFMSKQEDVTSQMRSILVDWLFEVADEHELHHETIFLAVNMVDRFLSVMHVDRSSFQLLGAAALFTASKYEEIYPPDVNQFSEVTDCSYSTTQILQMEQLLLRVLQFRVSVPTPYYFLTKIFSNTLTRFSQRTYHLAQYLCHLTLLKDQPFLEYYPSEIAIAATVLAAYQLESRDLITDKLMKMFKQSLNNQMERNLTKVTDRRSRSSSSSSSCSSKLPLCIEALHWMQEYAPSPENDQRAIYEKFSSHNYYNVANLKSVLDVKELIMRALQ